MNIGDDWVFGSFGRGLYKRCYEICYENFIVTVGCGLSELWDYRITRRTWILILFLGSATDNATGNATDMLQIMLQIVLQIVL